MEAPPPPKDLQEKLGGVIDFYLDNDREIHSPSDDSIAFVVLPY